MVGFDQTIYFKRNILTTILFKSDINLILFMTQLLENDIIFSELFIETNV